MSLRKITSLTALLSFIALAISSVFTYLAPRGPGSSQWEAWGMSKHDWFGMHTNLGVLFLIACIIHIILNIRPIIAYLKTKKDNQFRLFTLNFNVALLITLWFILSTVFQWPPVSSIQNFKQTQGNRGRHHAEAVVEKEVVAKVLPAKPPFFYSRKSINRICGEYADLDAEKIIERFAELGITAQADWTFKKIAQTNNMESAAVYDALQQVK